MSRTTRGNARRRLSYLATSSFVATSLLSGGAVLTAVLTPTAALAATATVDLGPIYADLAPLLVAVLVGFASWALHRIAQKFHVDALDGHRDVLAGAIANGVALAVKQLPQEASVDSKVAVAVNYVTPKVPDALKALKVTPENLASIIQARLPA